MAFTRRGAHRQRCSNVIANWGYEGRAVCSLVPHTCKCRKFAPLSSAVHHTHVAQRAVLTTESALHLVPLDAQRMITWSNMAITYVYVQKILLLIFSTFYYRYCSQRLFLYPSQILPYLCTVHYAIHKNGILIMIFVPFKPRILPLPPTIFNTTHQQCTQRHFCLK